MLNVTTLERDWQGTDPERFEWALSVAGSLAAGRFHHRASLAPGNEQVAEIAVSAEPMIATLVGAVPVVVARPQAQLVELDPLVGDAATKQWVALSKDKAKLWSELRKFVEPVSEWLLMSDAIALRADDKERPGT